VVTARTKKERDKMTAQLNDRHLGRTSGSALIATVFATLLGACGADGADESEPLALDKPCDVIDAGLGPSGDGGVDAGPSEVDASTPPPVPSDFALVTANGTGCPKGTWSVEHDADGTAALVFSAYEAVVDEETAVSVKDCQVALKVHPREGQSFSIADVSLDGYAFLEKGVRARQTARYYFQGNPVAADQVRADLVGPVDDAMVFEDKIATTDAVSQVWSPCGVDRDLNVYTSIRVQNSNPPAHGYVHVKRMNLPKLQWRTCAGQ
jgi:hypothetical protein